MSSSGRIDEMISAVKIVSREQWAECKHLYVGMHTV